MRSPTDDPLLARVRDALAGSAFLRTVASVRRDGGRSLALGNSPLRPLLPEEIAKLERQGNCAEDWSRVLVPELFDPSRIRNAELKGDIVLGRFGAETRIGEGRELSSGVYNSTLIDCVVGHDALVRDVRLLAGYVLGSGAVVFDCGQVTCAAGTTFGNGAVLSPGIESGGRPVRVYAEVDVETAAEIARPHGRRQLLEGYADAVEEYVRRASSERGIIEAGARLLNTPRVQNTYVGPGAVVDGATRVEDSTLLSSAEEVTRVESGACVSGSILQWGSSASTLAIVRRSVLVEHARAEQHGKVTDSLLGPNTAVGAGEVTSCLLGPFVSAHHQSLLIATLWPAGKGNVAYGANVGSNHTSRAPDQEFRPGEGMFLGLGVNVNFPADFSDAPYTVVACGVTLLPQKVTFPFSLIARPSVAHPGISPAYNEIVPGWMLSENLYALRRNEAKYRARNRARRTDFDFAVLRADTVERMLDGCRRLEAIRTIKEIYTESDLDGLGKNFLLECSRRRAVEGYRFFIRSYALLGLAGRVRLALEEGTAGACSRLLSTLSRDPRWEHQRQLLVRELGVTDIAAGLRELPLLLEESARLVEEGRARDDRRGARIVDDYSEAHVPACEDSFVRQTWEETRRLQKDVEELLHSRAAFGDHGSTRLLEAPMPIHDSTSVFVV